MTEASNRQSLSWHQAHEAAYRFIAGYYAYERSGPILRLLEAISWPSDRPRSDEETWAPWKQCVQDTLTGAPLPEPPAPWAS